MKEIINNTALLKLLNEQMSCALFEEGKTLLSVTKLAFYKEYQLVSAKTFSTIPSVEFKFLWNERENKVIKLDGDKSCFFDNIEILEPQITEQTAVAYVKFVLGSVWNENGAIKLCENIKEVEFSASPYPNQLSFLDEKIKPARQLWSSEVTRLSSIAT